MFTLLAHNKCFYHTYHHYKLQKKKNTQYKHLFLRNFLDAASLKFRSHITITTLMTIRVGRKVAFTKVKKGIHRFERGNFLHTGNLS